IALDTAVHIYCATIRSASTAVCGIGGQIDAALARATVSGWFATLFRPSEPRADTLCVDTDKGSRTPIAHIGVAAAGVDVRHDIEGVFCSGKSVVTAQEKRDAREDDKRS